MAAASGQGLYWPCQSLEALGRCDHFHGSEPGLHSENGKRKKQWINIWEHLNVGESLCLLPAGSGARALIPCSEVIYARLFTSKAFLYPAASPYLSQPLPLQLWDQISPWQSQPSQGPCSMGRQCPKDPAPWAGCCPLPRAWKAAGRAAAEHTHQRQPESRLPQLPSFWHS